MKLKILFFGTPSFAKTCLEELIIKEYDICGVITSPDKKSGRGLKLKKSIVKVFSEENKLKIFQPENLKNKKFLKEIKELKADIGVVVAFRKIPKELWEIPNFGTFNLHASLLPNYRGAAPINWSIIFKEKVTGVTTFLINDNIDSGDLLLQEKISIDHNENAGSLHDKLAIIGKNIIIKTIELFPLKFKPKKQIIIGNENIAPKLTRENTKIDWSNTLEDINNKIRGLSPSPGAWTFLVSGKENIIFKIFKASTEPLIDENADNEIIIIKKNLFVKHSDGLLKLEIVQLPNRKIMQTSSLLNGFSFKSGSKVI
ncbi:MAG: methionyl-tRNA formyltransferase [Flavobacteriaceae bacterium]